MNRARTGLVAAALLAVAAPVAITLATAPSAFAQAFTQWPKQCRPDIGRICRDVAKAEDKAILLCLQENEIKLSQACRKLLQSYGHVPNDPATTPAKRR
jgi:hypothetical protein